MVGKRIVNMKFAQDIYEAFDNKILQTDMNSVGRVEKNKVNPYSKLSQKKNSSPCCSSHVKTGLDCHQRIEVVWGTQI